MTPDNGVEENAHRHVMQAMNRTRTDDMCMPFIPGAVAEWVVAKVLKPSKCGAPFCAFSTEFSTVWHCDVERAAGGRRRSGEQRYERLTRGAADGATGRVHQLRLRSKAEGMQDGG